MEIDDFEQLVVNGVLRPLIFPRNTNNEKIRFWLCIYYCKFLVWEIRQDLAFFNRMCTYSKMYCIIAGHNLFLLKLLMRLMIYNNYTFNIDFLHKVWILGSQLMNCLWRIMRYGLVGGALSLRVVFDVSKFHVIPS